MADLQYFNYKDYGTYALENFAYNQAVRVGDKIELSGQGGWDSEVTPPTFATDLKSQVDQAFRNIDLALKAAGGKGISQVYRITSYHPKACGNAMPTMKENLLRWFPDHKPIWTAVGVENLGLPEMMVEIEAVAYDPQGAGGGGAAA